MQGIEDIPPVCAQLVLDLSSTEFDKHLSASMQKCYTTGLVDVIGPRIWEPIPPLCRLVRTACQMERLTKFSIPLFKLRREKAHHCSCIGLVSVILCTHFAAETAYNLLKTIEILFIVMPDWKAIVKTYVKFA